MRIIVTGSHGFLASHLIDRLKKDDHKIIGWDTFDGNDVCDYNLKAKDIDTIFHFACPVDPGNYKDVAIPTILASSIGTYNMLQLARINRAKFLYVSSSEVYGESPNIPFKESNPGIIYTSSPRSYYGESKRFGEMQTMVYHNFFKLDARIIRPFNIYGPGMRKNDSRVIPSFMKNKKENKPLIIHDDGKSTRTFCYIDDFIEGVMRVMFNQNTNGEIFNLGSEESVTMMELAKMISDNIEAVEYTRVGEQKHRVPNITKAKTILNWQPIIKLKEGLELMWRSYQ